MKILCGHTPQNLVGCVLAKLWHGVDVHGSRFMDISRLANQILVMWLSNSEGEDNAKDGVVQGVSGEVVR